jgi:hypothetical protein
MGDPPPGACGRRRAEPDHQRGRAGRRRTYRVRIVFAPTGAIRTPGSICSAPRQPVVSDRPEIPSGKRSGFGWPCARRIRAAMIGPAAGQASAQSATAPSGACKHLPLTGPTLAAPCCSALSASSNANSVGFRNRPDAGARSAPAPSWFPQARPPRPACALGEPAHAPRLCSRVRGARALAVAANTDAGVSPCRLARSTRSSHQPTTLSTLGVSRHRCGHSEARIPGLSRTLRV